MNIAISQSAHIPVTAIKPSKNEFRGQLQFDDLVESLDKAPLLHPVVVRRVPGTKNSYELISGARRLAAVTSRGESHIAARVVDATDLQAQMLQLTENIKRQGLGRAEPRAVARLKAIYHQLYPTRRGRHRKNSGHGDRKSASRELARALGLSERTLRRHDQVARGGLAADYESGKVNLRQAAQPKLLKMKPVNAHEKALDGLRTALKGFREARPSPRVRREAQKLLSALQEVLK